MAELIAYEEINT